MDFNCIVFLSVEIKINLDVNWDWEIFEGF